MADPRDKGSDVKLTARGAPSDRDNNVRLLSARQTPGFVGARQVLTQGILRRATSIILDFTPQAVGVKHMVDGLWLDGEPLERTAGDPVLETLKVLCGLDPKDRRARQEGTFAAEHEDRAYNATLTSQGVPTGERAVIQFEVKQTRFETLEELGMSAKARDQLKELLARPNGVLVFSALPAGGLRTLMNVALRSADRFTRDFVALEDEARRYEEVENIPPTTYKASGGQPAVEVLEVLLRTEPNVVVVRDLPDPQTASILFREALGERLVITSMRARDAAEALLRILALKVPPADFSKAVTAVVYQRLVRKLCEKCREAYAPPAQVLQQWGRPAGSGESFYRPPQQREKPCRACGDVGYVGRTGIFEILVVDPTMRKVLRTSPKLDLLRRAAQQAGARGLQAEGVDLVVQGVTALAEVARVLKQ